MAGIIKKIAYRIKLFLDTSKLVALWKVVWIKSFDKKIVLFNKYHPIYTDYFLYEKSDAVGWIYFRNAWAKWLVGRLLLKVADVYHIDASGYDSIFEKKGKRLIVECEGLAQGKYVNNTAVDAIVFQSRFAGRQQLGMEGSHLIYPAVCTHRWKHEKNHQQVFTMLTVGYGSFIKGFDVSYAIYAALKERGHNIRLIIAGSGGHNFDLYPEVTREAYANARFNEIESAMAADPGVEMHPFSRRDLFDRIYPGADVLLHFSRMETFGFTILEAMSFGLPVVSVRFKAIPEMVEHGANGFLCDPFHWDGQSPLNELCMNDPQWSKTCIEEGVAYVESIIQDKALLASMQQAALKKVKEFDHSKRSALLMPLYGAQ